MDIEQKKALIKQLQDEVMLEEVRLIYDYHPDGYLTHRTTGHQGRAIIGDRASTKDKTSGYTNVRLCNKNIKEHRAIWMWHYQEMPPDMIDHINNIRDDNRIENLRETTHAENQLNRIDSKMNGFHYRVNGKLTEEGRKRHNKKAREYQRQRAKRNKELRIEMRRKEEQRIKEYKEYKDR